ncbi:UNVERIFIED_CONTAM: Methyl-CpG-binding domain-containing protein 4 [Sesamum radiatum]|uniref:Methyl-CpG-binding domain-containing protein 4 n=1 Tax=Sesamum radiatum TaxID=300843 RepID=A0AAW2W2H2_SESRA
MRFLEQHSVNTSNFIDIWSVQCGECFKWRVIPTQEEFEEIRSTFAEDPFVCSKKPGIACDDPADIEYDDSRTWVIDKPNLPKSPAGFRRKLVMRKDFSKMDCYYDTPNGKRLRSLAEVARFLDKYPEYKEDVLVSDFSFTIPKIMEDTIPPDVAKKA